MLLDQTNLTRLLSSAKLGWVVNFASWFDDGPMEMAVMAPAHRFF